MSSVVCLLAGEASGDLLGADLMRSLKERLGEETTFIGVGGPLMEAEGLTSFFPMKELSVMGIWEIVPRLFSLIKRIRQTVDFIKDLQPDLIITIDSPGFNFRVLKKLRKQASFSIPVVHYVAPSVWAWRPNRAKKIAGLVDHLLALLPFEPPYFEKEGLATTFVGHPIATWSSVKHKTAKFRKNHNIPANVKIVTLLVGSRWSEVKQMAPIFAKTLSCLATQNHPIHIVIPTFERFLPFLKPLFSSLDMPITYITDETEKKEAYIHSYAALATSGTVALELSAFQVPCLIAYKTSWITYQIVKRLVFVKFAALPNILYNKMIIEEYLQTACIPSALGDSLSLLLKDKEKRQTMQKEMAEALEMLRPLAPFKTAGECAVQVITDKFLRLERKKNDTR